MAKTKAELLQENKELKAKLHGFRTANQTLGKRLKELQEKCQDLEFKAKGFQFAINGMQKEGDKLYQEKVALKDQLIKQKAKLNDAEEALEILRSQVAKIQYDEEVVADHAYQEGYDAASDEFIHTKKVYDDMLKDNAEHMDHMRDSMQMLTWLISRLYDLDKFVEAEAEREKQETQE